MVKKSWIDDQADYFLGKDPSMIKGKVFQCKKLQKRFDKATNTALAAGAILVAIVGAAIVFPIPPNIKAAASACSSSLFLMAGVIKGYVSSMGYAEQAISYEKMGAIFRGVQRLFEHDQSSRAEHLLALGKQALAEKCQMVDAALEKCL